MSMLLRLACASALIVTCGVSHATSGELGPYSSSIGEGNSAYGVDQDTFVVSRGFAINWYDSPVPASARFMDLQGSVGSVFETSDGLAPFMFTGVSLKSGDGSTVYGSVDTSQPMATIGFSFDHLAEGQYLLQFVGHYVRSPYEEGWGVQEWGYSVNAVASAAPEASDIALTGLGLVAVAVWSRRQSSRQPAGVQHGAKTI